MSGDGGDGVGDGRAGTGGSVGRLAATAASAALGGVRGATILGAEIFLLGPAGPLLTRGGRAIGRGALDTVQHGVRYVRRLHARLCAGQSLDNPSLQTQLERNLLNPPKISPRTLFVIRPRPHVF